MDTLSNRIVVVRIPLYTIVTVGTGSSCGIFVTSALFCSTLCGVLIVLFRLLL